MEKDISLDDMEKLQKKIHKLTKQEYLLNIKSIITKFNPDHPMTTNNNGVFLKFDNLSQETYKKLNAYVNSVISTTGRSKNLGGSPPTRIDSESEKEPEFKYSNKEKNIIKRCNYDKQCKNNESVFIKKTQN